MRKNDCFKKHILMPLAALATVATLLLGVNSLSVVSHAESSGKVIATTANIRQEPSASSTALGSATNGSTISIISQTTGTDGNIWYKVYVDANTTGYIRSDLVSVTDGSTPNNETTTTTANTTSTGATVSTDGVMMVNPVSASVTGGQSVRVRADASTSSSIVTTASNGLALTVTGSKDGSDGRTWYLVEFIDAGASVTGYIRSDFISLSEGLSPIVSETPAEVPAEPAPEAQEPVVAPEPAFDPTKAYDTKELDGSWFLVDNNAGVQYNIKDMFDTITSSATMYNDEHKKVKTFRLVMIIFIVVAVLAIAGCVYLFLKLRDIADQSAFADAERSRANRPAGTRPPARNGGQRPAGSRPAGSRPAGKPGQPGGGQRPAGARPAQPGNGQRPEGARPAQPGNGQRPEGARPAQTANGQRPEGARPAQPTNGPRPENGQGAAPQNATASRPAQNPAAGQNPANAAAPARAAKNFTEEDDEFEFGFLNWDGDNKN